MQVPTFNINAGDVARSVEGFIRENAVAFTTDAALAPVLGDVLLLLAIETVMNNTPLGQQNLIESSLINTSNDKTTAATSGPWPYSYNPIYRNHVLPLIRGVTLAGDRRYRSGKECKSRP